MAVLILLRYPQVLPLIWYTNWWDTPYKEVATQVRGLDAHELLMIACKKQVAAIGCRHACW